MSLCELLGRRLSEHEAKHVPDRLFARGPMRVPLGMPRAAVIGTRSPSERGIALAQGTAEWLVRRGYAVVSGLAKGIDAAAHKAAIGTGGRTIAVLGTPLDRAYPAENARLQAAIMEGHLAVSQFPAGSMVGKGNFVMRDRTMAVISDATVIVEAGGTSGTRHQGKEALRIGRGLFMYGSVLDDPHNEWAREMARCGAVRISNPSDMQDLLPPAPGIPGAAP